DRRRSAVGGANSAGLCARRLLGGASDGGELAVLRAFSAGGARTGVDPPRGAAGAPVGRWDGSDSGAVDRRDGEGSRPGWRAVAEVVRAGGGVVAGAAARPAGADLARAAAPLADGAVRGARA